MMGYTPLTSNERLALDFHCVPACIIIRSGGYHYALDGDCAMIASARSFEGINGIDAVVRRQGYAPVSSNSLAAAVIRDRLRLRGYDADEAGEAPNAEGTA